MDLIDNRAHLRLYGTVEDWERIDQTQERYDMLLADYRLRPQDRQIRFSDHGGLNSLVMDVHRNSDFYGEQGIYVMMAGYGLVHPAARDLVLDQVPLYSANQAYQEQRYGAAAGYTALDIASLSALPARAVKTIPKIAKFIGRVGHLPRLTSHTLQDVSTALRGLDFTVSPYGRIVGQRLTLVGDLPRSTPYTVNLTTRIQPLSISPSGQLVRGNLVSGFGEVTSTSSSFWNRAQTFTHRSQTNKVYQRSNLIDLGKKNRDGITNLDLMKAGKSPIGPDGRPINLHHILQTHNGPIAEVTETFHRKYSRIIHINPNTVGSGINRPEFNSWREKYWIARAKEMENLTR